MDRREQIRKLKLLREKKIREARESFWEFCKLTEPTFYKDSRTYLKEFCNDLQSLYEGKLINPETGEPYMGCIISFPPRHGKSRTITLFGLWVIGKDIQKSVIALSYNREKSIDFSRGARDFILAGLDVKKVVYQEVFPWVRIKRGNSAVSSWAIEGGYNTFLSTSFDGTLTGRGAKGLLVIDDPVPNADTALNDAKLNEQYEKYTGTVMSRVEDGALTIIVQTRWSKKDLAGRILDSPDGKNFYVVNYKACLDEEKEIMLCDEILNFKKYKRLKENMQEIIFLPNYQQVLIDRMGQMYPDLVTQKYEDVPRKEDGSPAFTNIVAYVDTADGGNDYFATVIAGVYNGYFYVLDMIYNQDLIDKNEDLLIEMLIKYDVKVVKIETNKHGRVFVNNIRKGLWEKHGTRRIVIEPLHQSKNKETRLLMNAPAVNSTIYFPLDIAHRKHTSEAWDHIITFPKTCKSNDKHDDIEDCLTGLVEEFGINSKKKMTVIKKPIGI